MVDTPKRQPDVRLRKIFARYLLSKVYITMETDEIGSKIWLLCDGSRSVKEIAEAITGEYDVDIETAFRDCRDFIQELETNKMVTWSA